jgi:hypothetical protein
MQMYPSKEELPQRIGPNKMSSSTAGTLDFPVGLFWNICQPCSQQSLCPMYSTAKEETFFSLYHLVIPLNLLATTGGFQSNHNRNYLSLLGSSLRKAESTGKYGVVAELLKQFFVCLFCFVLFF